MFIKVNKNWCD